MTTTIADVDFDLKLAEFRINGYVTLEQMIPHDVIDLIAGAFMPMLERVRERETELSKVERGDLESGLGKQQLKHRYTMTVPWRAPFTDPAVFEHPVILEFLDRYWGHDDYVVCCYHSNTPYPGTETQHWHRDTGLARDIPHTPLATVPAVGVKFPLVDTNVENGSIEVLPCTQHLVDAELESRYDDILCRGDFGHAVRLNLKKGSMWIQDIRTLHRGTRNTSSTPRPEIVVCYSQPWFAIRQEIRISASDFANLSDRGRKLMAKWAPATADGSPGPW